MNRFRAVVLLIASVAALLLAGCGRKSSTPPPAAPGVASAHGEAQPAGPTGSTPEPSSPTPGGMPPPGMGGSQMVQDATPPGATPTAAAGLAWSRPAGWGLEPARTMRIATYRIPPVGGDSEPAECAVYYFGPGQGGGVEANLTRWIGQFQPATSSKRSTRTVNGVNVSLADAAGTYTAHGGAMTQPQGDVTGWRLLGAIAEGPEGTVFFKLTGPEKTVAAAKGPFDGMIGSLKRQ